MAQVGGLAINNPYALTPGSGGAPAPAAAPGGGGGLFSGQGGNPVTAALANVHPGAAPGQVAQTTTGGATGLGGTQLNAPLYVQGIQQEYGAQLANAPQAQQILTSQSQAQQQQYNDAAAAAIANAQQQNAGNQAYLQNQINSTQQGQTLSLSELAQQIRAQHQGLGAQLGAVGAGSSSAAGLGNQGLAQEQNTQRANIQQQAGASITGLQTQQGAQTADTNTLIQGYKKTAADQVATVQTNYAQLMNQLSVALNQAQGEEKARLAEFGQSLTNAANTSLTNIESQLQNNTGALLSQGAASLQQGTLPTPTGVNPITAPQVTPFNVGAGAQNTTASPAGGSLQALLQQQAHQPIGV